jgi:hypothetical protein
MAAQVLMAWMGLVTWMDPAAQVTVKKRTYRLVLCDDGGPRLDDLDGSGGLARVEKENATPGHHHSSHVFHIKYLRRKYCTSVQYEVDVIALYCELNVRKTTLYKSRNLLKFAIDHNDFCPFCTLLVQEYYGEGHWLRL